MKLLEGDGSSGGGNGLGPFANYLAISVFGTDAGKIRTYAETTTHANKTLGSILDDLKTNRAVVGRTIDGAPADPTLVNVDTLDAKTRKTHRRGIVFEAAMLKLAELTETHDSKIRAEASSHPDAKPDKARELARPINNWLDGQADDIADLLDGDPQGLTVKDLILQGYIPLGAADYWPEIKLTTEQKKQAEENTFRRMTPDEQVTYVKEHKNISFDVTQHITPEAARTLAEDVGGDVENKEITDETVRILGLLHQSAPFTNALFTRVDPNEWGDAILDINQDLFRSTGPMVSERPNIELYNGFMNAAGLALATYSRNSADPAALATTWANAITDSDNPENAAALTLLIREGGEQKAGVYDATFIDQVTEKVYQWERDHDGDPVWGPKADALDVLIRDPDKVTISKYENIHGDVSWSFGGGNSADGLANLLAGMGNSPEGAQRFFQDSDGNVDKAKLDYLIGEKDGDDVNGRTFASVNGSDEGDGLGEALEAAAVGRGADATFAATLATDVFNRVGDLSGHDPTTAHDSGWHVWEEMTDNLGNIAAGYAGDVYDIINDDSGTDAPGHLNIDPGVLDKVLGEIGRGDKSGIENLSAAIVIEGNARIGAVLDDLPPGERTVANLQDRLPLLIQGQAATNGEVLGHILGKSVLVDIADEEVDQKRREYMAKAFDLATGFIPGGGKVLGETASHLATATYDTAQKEALGYLKGEITTPSGATSETHLETTDDALRRQMEHGLVNQLVQHGYFGAPPHYPGVPEGLLVVDENGTRQPIFRADLFDDPHTPDGGKALDGKTDEPDVTAPWRDWKKKDDAISIQGIVTDQDTSFNDAVEEAVEQARKG